MPTKHRSLIPILPSIGVNRAVVKAILESNWRDLLSTAEQSLIAALACRLAPHVTSRRPTRSHQSQRLNFGLEIADFTRNWKSRSHRWHNKGRKKSWRTKFKSWWTLNAKQAIETRWKLAGPLGSSTSKARPVAWQKVKQKWQGRYKNCRHNSFDWSLKAQSMDDLDLLERFLHWLHWKPSLISRRTWAR